MEETALPPAAPASAALGLASAARTSGASKGRQRGYRASRGAPLLLFAGLAAALWAQQVVVAGASGEVASLGFGVAIALFMAGLARLTDSGLLTTSGATGSPPESHAPDPVLARGLGLAWWPALGALALGVITFLACGDNRFTAFNLTTWVGSVVLGLAACWQPQPWARVRRLGLRGAFSVPSGGAAGGASGVPLTGMALAAVVLLGAFLLYFRLDDVPREMTSDHAEKLLDVQDVLDGRHRIFFPRNTGREAFQFYWIALMTPLAGVSYLTMKLGTALLACFTLPVTFLFARVFFGTQLALLATALLAISRWHLQVARVGLRFPFPPLFGAATFYFLLRALRDRRRSDFALCGLALGIAQHTYTALRLAPLGVLGCIAVALAVGVWRREPAARARRLLVDTGLLFAIAGLAFVPLARYALDEPGTFLYRGASRIVSDSLDAPAPNLLPIFLDNVRRAFLMFNWRGDVVWVNNIPGERLLDPVSGALFVLGCAYALYRVVRYREVPYVYLFVLLATGILPSTLSLAYPGEVPSTVRSGMAIPVVMVFVALPILLLVRRVRAWVGGLAGQITATIALGLLLSVIFSINFDQYFRIYARQHNVASQHTTHVARAVNDFLATGGRREDVHLMSWSHWIDARLVAIQTGDVRWQPGLASVAEVRRHDGGPRARLYIVHPDDNVSLEAFGRWYPQAVQHVVTLEELDGRPWFATVLVPPGVVASG